MAQDLNTVALVGNLTKDPELRHTPSGTPVTSLRIAVNDRVKRRGEWTDAAYYFDVIVWGNQAESCVQYLGKGKKVGVQGKLTWRDWEAQDGSKRQSVEINANSVQFLTPRSDGDGQSGSYGDYAPPPDAEPARRGEGGDYGVPGQDAEPQPAPAPTASQDDDIPF